MINILTSIKLYEILLATLVFMLIISSCVGKSDPSNFYMLQPIEASIVPSKSVLENNHIAVQVGPIIMPAYLDRSQIVMTTKTNQLIIDEFSRWAEPLTNNFSRVLVENLSQLLKTPNIYPYNSGNSQDARIQVSVFVTRFDVTKDGDAYLNAFWMISDTSDDDRQLSQKSSYHSSISSADISDAVKAQNLLLTEFSKDIADAIHSFK